MSALEKYLERRNAWHRLTGRREWTVETLGAFELAELDNDVECELSPENLTCDGELSRHQVIKKARFLHAVQKEIASRMTAISS